MLKDVFGKQKGDKMASTVQNHGKSKKKFSDYSYEFLDQVFQNTLEDDNHIDLSQKGVIGVKYVELETENKQRESSETKRSEQIALQMKLLLRFLSRDDKLDTSRTEDLKFRCLHISKFSRLDVIKGFLKKTFNDPDKNTYFIFDLHMLGSLTEGFVDCLTKMIKK